MTEFNNTNTIFKKLQKESSTNLQELLDKIKAGVHKDNVSTTNSNLDWFNKSNSNTTRDEFDKIVSETLNVTLKRLMEPSTQTYKGDVEHMISKHNTDGIYFQTAPFTFLYFVPPDLAGIDYDYFSIKKERGFNDVISEVSKQQTVINADANQQHYELAILPDELKGVNIGLRQMLKQDVDYYPMADRPTGYNNKILFNRNTTIPILNNFAVPSSINTIDGQMSTFDSSENVILVKQVLPKTIIDSYATNQVTVTFNEIGSAKYGTAMITNLHKAWIKYMEYVVNGQLNPTAKYTSGINYRINEETRALEVNVDDDNGTAQIGKSKEYRRAINYFGALYYFKLEPDGKTLVHWGKWTGLFPTQITSSTFNSENGHPKIQVQYQSQFFEENNIQTLIEFNMLNVVYNIKFNKNSANDAYKKLTEFSELDRNIALITYKDTQKSNTIDRRYQLYVGNEVEELLTKIEQSNDTEKRANISELDDNSGHFSLVTMDSLDYHDVDTKDMEPATFDKILMSKNNGVEYVKFTEEEMNAKVFSGIDNIISKIENIKVNSADAEKGRSLDNTNTDGATN